MSNDDEVRDTDPTGRYIRVRNISPFLSFSFLGDPTPLGVAIFLCKASHKAGLGIHSQELVVSTLPTHCRGSTAALVSAIVKFATAPFVGPQAVISVYLTSECGGKGAKATLTWRMSVYWRAHDPGNLGLDLISPFSISSLLISVSLPVITYIMMYSNICFLLDALV